jgi:hypothetical protein
MTVTKQARQIIGVSVMRFAIISAATFLIGAIFGFSYRPILDHFMSQRASSAQVVTAAHPTSSASTFPWVTKEVSLTMYEGTESGSMVEIARPTGVLSSPSVKATDGLAGIAVVDLTRGLPKGDNMEFPLTVDLPATSKASYTGTLQLMNDGKPVGVPLTVTVKTKWADCQTIPAESEFPSPDRIGSLAGSPVIDDVVELSIKDTTKDQAAIVRAVACKYKAQIVGSVSDVGLYELRIPGQKIETLLPIIDQIKNEPGVDNATASLLVSANSATGPQ